MKLLLFSDLHANIEAAHELVELARGADVLIGAGDFGNQRRDVDKCIEILRAVPKPAVLVPGNNESLHELQVACEQWPQAQVLHGSSTEINGVTFYGIGGGIPKTPFGEWSYDFSEEEATQLLKDCPRGCVLLSHSPPLNTVDASAQRSGLGSAAVRQIVLQREPVLVVCGHIHGSAGQQVQLGKSTIINAGPSGIWWEL